MAPKMAPKVAPSKETLVAGLAWAPKLEPDASGDENPVDRFTALFYDDECPEGGGVAKKPAGQCAKSKKAMKAVKVMKAMPAKKSMKAMKAMKAMKVMKAMDAMKATTSVEEDIDEEADKEAGADDNLDNGEGAEEEEMSRHDEDILDAAPKKKARAKGVQRKPAGTKPGGQRDRNKNTFYQKHKGTLPPHVKAALASQGCTAMTGIINDIVVMQEDGSHKFKLDSHRLQDCCIACTIHQTSVLYLYVSHLLHCIFM